MPVQELLGWLIWQGCSRDGEHPVRLAGKSAHPNCLNRHFSTPVAVSYQQASLVSPDIHRAVSYNNSLFVDLECFLGYIFYRPHCHTLTSRRGAHNTVARLSLP